MVKIGSWLGGLSVFCVVIGSVVGSPGGAHAATVVSATLRPNPAAVGEPLVLTISAQAEGAVSLDDVRLPQLDGFSLVQSSGIGERSQTVFSGGRLQTTVSRDYGLVANRPGNLVLGSIIVVVDGEQRRTQPLQIKILPAGTQLPRAQPKEEEEGWPGEDEADQIFNQLLRRHGMGGGFQAEPQNPNEAYHVLVEVDKTKAFVGEQILATWSLVTRGLIQSFDPLKYPQLKGFWKEDIEIVTNLVFKNVVIKGQPYQKALLMRSALFPIKEGTTIIDPYKTKATVVLGGRMFGQPYVFNKASQEVKVQVEGIPTAGRPADFTGAVGSFQMSNALNTSGVVAHQPFEYKLRVQGVGNAKSVELPPLNLPANLELYDQKSEAKFNPDGTSHKDFVLYLIPREAGAIKIPVVSMSYFEPSSRSFKRISAPEVVVQVKAGAGVPATAGSESTGPKEAVKPPKVVVQPTTEWVEPSPVWLHWVLGCLVLAGVGLGSAWRFGLLAKTEKKRQLRQEVRSRCKVMEQLVKDNDPRKLGAAGANLVYWVLGELSDAAGSTETFEVMMGRVPPSIRNRFQKDLQELLRQFETLSFAPPEQAASAASDLKKLVLRSRDVLLEAVAVYEGED